MADNSNLYTAKYSLVGVFINTLWFGIVPKLPSLINVILLPIITPYLSAWDYGVWGKISAYTSMVTAFCTLGLHVHLTNSYYEYGKKYSLVWSRLNLLLHLISLICGTILCFIFLFSLVELPLMKRFVIATLSICPVLFSPNQLLASHLFPLRAQPKPLVLRNLIASLSGLAFLYISVVIFKKGFVGFVLSASITAVVGYVLFYSPLKKENITLNYHNRWERIKKWVLIGLPLVPHTLGFALLSSSTRIVMDICGIKIEEIGLFTSGVTVGSYVVLITSAMASSLSPQIQQFYRRRELKNFRYLFYIDQLISIVCIFLFSLWMKELYTLLIRNDELFVAFSIAQVVCFANLIYPFYHFTSNIISIQKRTVHMLWLAFVPGIICVILNFILLPIYGYEIAAVVSVASYWVMFLLPLVIPYLHHITKEWLGGIWKIPVFIFLSGLTILGVHYLSNIGFYYKILYSLVFCVASSGLLIRLNNNIKR